MSESEDKLWLVGFQTHRLHTKSVEATEALLSLSSPATSAFTGSDMISSYQSSSSVDLSILVRISMLVTHVIVLLL